MAGEQDRIGKKVRAAISSGEQPVVVSAVVIWEIAIKRRLDKLEAPEDLLAQFEGAGVDLLPITPRHADRVATLPLHHRDPFDRLLIAQADIEELTVATADPNLGRYGIKVLW